MTLQTRILNCSCQIISCRVLSDLPPLACRPFRVWLCDINCNIPSTFLVGPQRLLIWIDDCGLDWLSSRLGDWGDGKPSRGCGDRCGAFRALGLFTCAMRTLSRCGSLRILSQGVGGVLRREFGGFLGAQLLSGGSRSVSLDAGS